MLHRPFRAWRVAAAAGLVLAVGSAAMAQPVWKLSSGNFDGTATTSAVNCTGLLQQGSETRVGLLGGYLGNDFAQLAWNHSALISDCVTDGIAFSWVTVNGTGTSVVTIEFECKAQTDHDCCRPVGCPFTGTAVADLMHDLGLSIANVAPGTPETVFYNWSGYSFHIREHEAGNEDPANVVCRFYLQGVEQTLGRLDVLDASTPATVSTLNAIPNQSGVLTVIAPGPVTIAASADTNDIITVPGEVLPCFFPPDGWRDNGVASFFGRITLSLTVPPPPPPPGPATMAVEFSVDIGSDYEFSDPAASGTEVFDPGDLYVWKGPLLPPGGMNGVRDDADILPAPLRQPDPAPGTIPAPTCAGPLSPAFFDLDGYDSSDADLGALIPLGAPLLAPIAPFSSSTIFGADHLFVSFDDDGPGSYASCDSPNQARGSNNGLFGQTLRHDEVVGVDVSAALVPRMVQYIYPYLNEQELHLNFAPNPDLSEQQDDDCDALDLVEAAGRNRRWYFSADHEASGNLDPGDIYVRDPSTPAGRHRMVDNFIHLGLADGVDLRDFEFVWLKGPAAGGMSLAVLFAVSEDDFATADDESGGLDPRMIYASFMTGSSFAFLNLPLKHPIDGLASWWDNLDPRFAPAVCPIDYNGDGLIDFLDYLEFLNLYNSQDPRADLNGDGQVDFADYLVFLNFYAGPCP